MLTARRTFVAPAPILGIGRRTAPPQVSRRAAAGRRRRAVVGVFAYSLETALNGRRHFESCDDVVGSLGDDALEGKRVLITGATGGIGKRTAQALVEMGATVLVTARSAAKAKECAAEIGGEAVPYDLDLGSLASVRQFVADAAEELEPLDVLIANAGIGMVPGRKTTVDGHEIAWGTNHLGHFALVQGLLPAVEASEDGRIVVVSSETHREVSTGYCLEALDGLCDKRHQVVAYEHSKLCNLLFASELARRVRKAGVSVYACCPGFVDTGLRRHLAQTPEEEELFRMLYDKESNPMLKDIDEGAATTVFLAAAPRRELGRDLYWTNCAPLDPSDTASDREVAKQLWEDSEALVAQTVSASSTGTWPPRKADK